MKDSTDGESKAFALVFLLLYVGLGTALMLFVEHYNKTPAGEYMEYSIQLGDDFNEIVSAKVSGNDLVFDFKDGRKLIIDRDNVGCLYSPECNSNRELLGIYTKVSVHRIDS